MLIDCRSRQRTMGFPSIILFAHSPVACLPSPASFFPVRGGFQLENGKLLHFSVPSRLSPSTANAVLWLVLQQTALPSARSPATVFRVCYQRERELTKLKASSPVVHSAKKSTHRKVKHYGREVAFFLLAASE